MTTLADQLIEVLLQAGVQRIYGVVGDSLNPVVDAVRRTNGLEWVHVRNEEAGAFAAAAEAQLTGRLAVCAGSCGPGNTHLIQGLYDAHRSGGPVLAIASHIPSGQVGTSFFQETHPERLFVECSGYCELVSQAGQMPRDSQDPRPLSQREIAEIRATARRSSPELRLRLSAYVAVPLVQAKVVSRSARHRRGIDDAVIVSGGNPQRQGGFT